MTDYRWRIIEDVDVPNVELRVKGTGLADGVNGKDNYLCGECGHILAKNISKDFAERLILNSVRCPNCGRINAVEWFSE